MDTITLNYFDYFDKNKEKNLTFSKSLIGENIDEKSLFTLRVDGESMQPMIKNKSLVVANLKDKNLKENSIYIIYHGNKMWIKKAIKQNQEFLFVSINEKFKHLVYKKSECLIVAKVLLTFTTFD